MKLDTDSFKISVIIPFYKRDRFKDITELIDSVQAQSYRNIETVIVTERSPKLAESCEELCPGYELCQCS
ncbi:glycosyltransferase [Chloroflexota bacterium]